MAKKKKSKKCPVNKIIILVIAVVVVALVLVFRPPKGIETTVDIPTETAANIPFEVTITVDQNNLEMFDISELVPLDWELVSWNVAGNNSAVEFEIDIVTYGDQARQSIHWKLTDQTSNKVTISYLINPTTTGDNEIITLTVYPVNFNTIVHDITIV